MGGLLATDASCFHSFAQEGEGLRLEYFHTDGWPDPVRATQVFNEHLSNKVVGWAWYNPIRPERTQRNVALRTSDLGKRPQDLPSHVARMGVGGMDQLRVLVCEGPSLLAWVGAMQHELFDEHQKRLLQRLVPALRKRLIVERTLGRASFLDAALSASLDAIGSPAFLITIAGRIVEMNAVAERLRAHDAKELAAALVRCARYPERSSSFTVTRVEARGCPDHFLVIARPDPGTEREDRVSSATRRWGLTVRQSQVLSGVAEGLTNRAIAATLGIAERTVEVHLTAIFEKVQVENRAELVASVWRH